MSDKSVVGSFLFFPSSISITPVWVLCSCLQEPDSSGSSGLYAWNAPWLTKNCRCSSLLVQEKLNCGHLAAVLSTPGKSSWHVHGQHSATSVWFSCLAIFKDEIAGEKKSNYIFQVAKSDLFIFGSYKVSSLSDAENKYREIWIILRTGWQVLSNSPAAYLA